jgi:hypothetical protein
VFLQLAGIVVRRQGKQRGEAVAELLTADFLYGEEPTVAEHSLSVICSSMPHTWLTNMREVIFPTNKILVVC